MRWRSRRTRFDDWQVERSRTLAVGSAQRSVRGCQRRCTSQTSGPRIRRSRCRCAALLGERQETSTVSAPGRDTTCRRVMRHTDLFGIGPPRRDKTRFQAGAKLSKHRAALTERSAPHLDLFGERPSHGMACPRGPAPFLQSVTAPSPASSGDLYRPVKFLRCRATRPPVDVRGSPPQGRQAGPRVGGRIAVTE